MAFSSVLDVNLFDNTLTSLFMLSMSFKWRFLSRIRKQRRAKASSLVISISYLIFHGPEKQSIDGKLDHCLKYRDLLASICNLRVSVVSQVSLFQSPKEISIDVGSSTNFSEISRRGTLRIPLSTLQPSFRPPISWLTTLTTLTFTALATSLLEQ